VKIASLYVGAGSGVGLSCPKSSAGGDGSGEDELLHALRRCAIVGGDDGRWTVDGDGEGVGKDGDDGSEGVEMTVLMDANRAVRPMPVTGGAAGEGMRGGTTMTTNSATEVYYSLFPDRRRGAEHSDLDLDNRNGRDDGTKRRKKNNKGVYLFPVHDDGLLMRMLPSPIDEVMGVFHIKVSHDATTTTMMYPP